MAKTSPELIAATGILPRRTYACVTCGHHFVARSDKASLECLVCLWYRVHDYA